ncbi:MAG TPA: carbamoyltransferase C-terminal domain-containing protein, partial [Anaerovoracaceae bacterium]|nr:carbamoyltransferase C-terminal domain-containing protein [Anaerovoracaceae bacterium]
SECGPRALGNRSIICDPSGAGKKDLINEKIKHREWFRPFAPVVKAEDVEKYFDFSGESRFMSYAPTVRTEYIDIIPAVVHKDATARVQTVTRAQNKFLYNLLDEFERISGIGVLLNTSLNIKGLPILTTLRDAFDVWNSTELDALYIEGWLFEKDRL